MKHWGTWCLASLMIAATATSDEIEPLRSLVVEATAYNSVPEQTGPEPTVGAWGDPLEPGMKVIAVSPDLLDLGLDHDTKVSIEGLPGTYRVLDRMAPRWEKRIDIYMGDDVARALSWGVRTVRIYW